LCMAKSAAAASEDVFKIKCRWSQCIKINDIIVTSCPSSQKVMTSRAFRYDMGSSLIVTQQSWADNANETKTTIVDYSSCSSKVWVTTNWGGLASMCVWFNKTLQYSCAMELSSFLFSIAFGSSASRVLPVVLLLLWWH
jgi:hypothetical protein